jgi:hypothetical protein
MTKIEQLFKNEETAYLNANSITDIDGHRFNLKMLGYEDSEIEELDRKRSKAIEDKKVIGFFKTQQLAENKIIELYKNISEGDSSTFFVEKEESIFVVYGIIKRSEELQKQLDEMFV